MLEINKIYQGSALEVLKTFPDESVNCCITSPPYWALRSYLNDDDEMKCKELGLESTFQEYINNLCDIFDEVKRVLTKEGTCFVVLGDTYGNPKQSKNKLFGNSEFNGNRPSRALTTTPKMKINGLDKCLCQIPSRFGIEMVDRGWLLRNRLIWQKPNAMPSSAKDRFTIDYEDVLFFSKSKKYCFNQQFEPCDAKECAYRHKIRKSKKYNLKYEGYKNNFPIPSENTIKLGRNKRSVWGVATKKFPGAHFATYPDTLIAPMILAGCPEGGVVLDPFGGAMTTCVAAIKYKRNYVAIELNPDYIIIGEKRIKNTPVPLF